MGRRGQQQGMNLSALCAWVDAWCQFGLAWQHLDSWVSGHIYTRFTSLGFMAYDEKYFQFKKKGIFIKCENYTSG